MKTMLIAAALMMSGAAIAQNRPSTGPAGTTDQMQSTGNADTTSKPDAMTTGQTGADAQPTTPTNQSMQTGTMNQQPMQDGSMTQPGTMQPGMTQPGMMQPGMSQSGMASGDYPRCSRTVTDRCIQTAARSPRPRRGR